MNNRPASFSEKLKIARSQFRDAEHTSKGLTLRELGERSGVRFTHIADFEAGKRIPGADALQRLAIALGLDKEAAKEFVAEGLKDIRISKVTSGFPSVPNEAAMIFYNEVCKASGKSRDSAVRDVSQKGDCDMTWQTEDGIWFAIEVTVATGPTQRESLNKLWRRLGRGKSQGRVKPE